MIRRTGPGQARGQASGVRGEPHRPGHRAAACRDQLTVVELSRLGRSTTQQPGDHRGGTFAEPSVMRRPGWESRRLPVGHDHREASRRPEGAARRHWRARLPDRARCRGWRNRGVQEAAHRSAMLAEEPHHSFQPERFDSVQPHAPKSACKDPGMLLCGMRRSPHVVGGAAAEGGQSSRGRLVVTGQPLFQRMPLHGHPRRGTAVQGPGTATPAIACVSVPPQSGSDRYAPHRPVHIQLRIKRHSCPVRARRERPLPCGKRACPSPDRVTRMRSRVVLHHCHAWECTGDHWH